MVFSKWEKLRKKRYTVNSKWDSIRQSLSTQLRLHSRVWWLTTRVKTPTVALPFLRSPRKLTLWPSLSSTKSMSLLWPTLGDHQLSKLRDSEPLHVRLRWTVGRLTSRGSEPWLPVVSHLPLWRKDLLFRRERTRRWRRQRLSFKRWRWWWSSH